MLKSLNLMFSIKYRIHAFIGTCLLILFTSLFLPLMSQQNKPVDSISVIMNLNVHDSIKMRKLYLLSKTGNKDIWEDMFALKAFKKLAVKNNLPERICFVNNEIGYKYQMKGFSDSAFKIYKENVDIALKNKDSSLWVRAIYKVGFLLNSSKQNEKAAPYFELLEKYVKNPAGKASIQLAMGANYMDMGKQNLAMEYLHKALLFFESDNKPSEQLEFVYSNLGSIYLNQNKHDLAEQYFQKSKATAEQLNDNGGIIMSYMNLATLCNIQKKHRMALSYLKSIESRIENDYDDYKKMNFDYEMYKSYAGVNNFEKASQHLHKAYVRKEELYKAENSKTLTDIEQKYQNKNKQLEIENQKLLIAKKDSENILIAEQKKKQTGIFIAVIAVLLLNGIFIYNRYLKSKRDKETILHHKNLIQEKQTEILDSISYAKRIQEAIIPPMEYWQKHLPDSFVLYLPKDIVAGDFYWMDTDGDNILFAAADCTGHGVPGAMVSVICSNAMNRAIKEFKLRDPGMILDKVRELVLETFEKSTAQVNDGMDISFCVLNKQSKMLHWAGANNPLWILRATSNALEEIKPNKQPIGKFIHPEPFTTQRIQLNDGDTMYCFTDGYADQFGGEKGKKFMYRQLKNTLLKLARTPVNEQKQKLLDTFSAWKGELEQVDDVTFIGIKI